MGNWELFSVDDDRPEPIEYEIQSLRRALGMPPLSFKKVRCSRLIDVDFTEVRQCNREFYAQYVGANKRTHYCQRCKYFLAKQTEIAPAMVGFQ